MPSSVFNKITLIGVGLIGGSLGLALKEKRLVKKITGFSRNINTLEDAKRIGIIDEFSNDLEVACNGSEAIFISTPLGTYDEISRRLAGIIKDGVIVSDLGSVKHRPSEFIRANLGEKAKYFVPAHPIAGTEKSGPSAAFANLYASKKLILTPFVETDKNSADKIRDMWQRLGCHVSYMDSKMHDEVYARVSHIVQLLSSVFGFCIINEGIDNFKNSQEFQNFLRLTGSDAVMWDDILRINLENIEPIIENISDLIKKPDSINEYVKNAGEVRKFIEPEKSVRTGAENAWGEVLPLIIASVIINNLKNDDLEYASGAGLKGMTCHLSRFSSITYDNTTIIIEKYRNSLELFINAAKKQDGGIELLQLLIRSRKAYEKFYEG